MFLLLQDPYKSFGLPSIGRLSQYQEPINLPKVSHMHVHFLLVCICSELTSLLFLLMMCVDLSVISADDVC